MPEQPTRGTAPLYLELPTALRRRLDEFVQRTRRKLKGEVCNAIEQYLDREEAKAPAAPADTPKETPATPKRPRGRPRKEQ